MKPTNVLYTDEFLVKQRQGALSIEDNKLKKSGTSGARLFKSEKKNATIGSIMTHEYNHLSSLQVQKADLEDEKDCDQNCSFYEQLDENLNYKIEKEHQIETKYAWAHLS